MALLARSYAPPGAPVNGSTPPSAGGRGPRCTEARPAADGRGCPLPAGTYIDAGGGGVPPRRGMLPMDITSPKTARIAGIVIAGLAMVQPFLSGTGRPSRTGRLSGPGLQRVGGSPVYEAAAAVGGVLMLVAGFVFLHRKRAIENVPRSRIRSVAMGFAELSGKARGRTPLVAPLSGTMCAFYRYLVEQEESSSRGGSRWRTVDQGQSTEWFYLDDETGSIVVDPDGIDAELGRDYNRIERGEGLFGRRKRYSEWRLDGGEPAYIVGTVRKLRNLAQEHQAAVHERLRDLKRDAARMQALDTNHDGQISTEEWGNAVRVVENEVLKEEIAARSGPPQDDLIIAKGDAEKTFIISDKGERAIVRTLAWKSALLLAGGAALSVGGTISLLARAGVVGRGLLLW